MRRAHGRRGVAAGIVGAALILLPGAAWAAEGRITLEVPNSSGTQRGFDLEAAQLVLTSASSADVRTGTHTTLGYRQLAAMNGAGVARLGTVDFDAVTCDDLRTAPYVSQIFTGPDGFTDPEPGTVYAVRSVAGTFAKFNLVEIDFVAPNGLVLDFWTSDCPSDDTPPIIEPTVDGAEGNDGWYVGDVTVSWIVFDPESPLESSDGCDETVLADDTAATTVTCSASSAGGTSSVSVTVAIDQTPPLVGYEGNEGTYDVDDQVQIGCVASDATSGVASDTCESVDAPAYEFGPGEHTLSATATDAAGNDGEGSTTFTVVVTPDGMIGLIEQLIDDPGLKKQLTKSVEQIGDAPNEKAKANQVTAFTGKVEAQAGKKISEDVAALLIEFAQQL